MFDILSQIKGEISDYIDNHIEVVPGYIFDTYRTIKRIHLYMGDRFEEQPDDEDYNPVFVNISRPRAETVATFIDVDMSDIRIFEMNPTSHFAAMFYDYEVKQKLRAEEVSKKLNKMAHIMATYGTVVVEKTSSGFDVTDLRYLFLDPTVETITKSRFVTTKHFLHPDALRSKVKEGWDKKAIERIIMKKGALLDENAQMSYEDSGYENRIRGGRNIEIYRRFGQVPRWFIDEKTKGTERGEEPVMAVCIVAEPYMTSKDKDGRKHDEYELLYAKEWKKPLPFYDAKLFEVEGRWLGLGTVEALFPMQEMVNELVNQQRLSMTITMMHLFQTADPTVVSNILSQLQSGDVIKTKTPGAIQPINTQDLGLSSYNLQMQNVMANADRVSFANDILTGGDVPTSTPATNVVLQNNNATKIHLLRRQKFTILLRKVIKEFILPQVNKELNSEHLLKFVGNREQLEEIDNKEAIARTNKEIDALTLKGVPVTQLDQKRMFETTLKELKKYGAERYTKILKDYYSKHQFDLEIIIDDENIDMVKITQNTFNYMNMLAGNPQSLDDPVLREFTMDYGRRIGMNTGRLEMAFAERQSQQEQLPAPQQQQVA